jgi:transcriptional regulator with XRE-family HTH domain
MFVKSEARHEARRLRAEAGLSIRDIAARLAVSKSSVSLWVRDIALTPEQEAALQANDPVRNGRLIRGGCMLYWAEGSKTRNCVQIANADAELLRVFLDFLRRCYAVPNQAVTFSVNCFLGNGLSLREIEEWWLARLSLPPTCLRKAAVNRPSSASRGRRGNVLPYGTGRLSVHSTFMVQSIYGAIQEYAGIDRPEWLDL